MFKSMRLSVKIGVGFSVVILICIALGATAAFNMTKVMNKARMLDEAYVPEVRVANELERNALQTMYNMRGYALSEDVTFYDTGSGFLKAANDQLDAAKELAAGNEQLVKLQDAVGVIDADLTSYADMIGDTAAELEVIAGIRSELDAAAQGFMGACESYLTGQKTVILERISTAPDAADLQERVEKIYGVSEIVDLGNSIRLATWRAQAQRDLSLASKGREAFSTIDERLAAVRKITRLPEDLAQLDTVDNAAKQYDAAMGKLVAAWEELDKLSADRGKVADNVLAKVKDISTAGMDQTVTIANDAATSLGLATTVVLVGLGAAAVLSILIATVITRAISKPLNVAIAGLGEGASQVRMASGQVAESSQQMAEGASEQASSLEETSASLEEMSSMTRQNADNAKQASILAQDAQKAAQEGRQAMTRMEEAIHRIKSSSDETAKIMKTIDEIAFQTNLLALNAAVEAARAGEAGKGFAVVAEEVRNLAQRSAEAARNTAQLLDDARNNAANGVAVTAEVGKSLEHIVEGARKVTSLINEVSNGSEEQSQGIDQLNTAMSQMDKVTQANAANSEEAAAASEELAGQAESLAEIVEQLRTLVSGSNGGASGGALAQSAHANGKAKASIKYNNGDHNGHGGNGRHPLAMPDRRKAAARVDGGQHAALPAAEMAAPLTEEELAEF